jgi:hypothetical protein
MGTDLRGFISIKGLVIIYQGGVGRCNSKFEGMIFCHPALP